MKVHDRSPILTPIVIGFLLFLIGSAQITALWALTRVILPTFIESTSLEEVQTAQLSPQIYRLKVVDNRIQLIPTTIDSAATSPQIALEEALEKLLARSSGFDVTTTIPQGTRLLDLHISEDGVHIDLSQEFTQGGGSSSMIYRVAQILYTATSIDPQMPVFFSVEGKPLDEDNPLGGEGILLEYPLTRQVFNRDFLAE